MGARIEFSLCLCAFLTLYLPVYSQSSRNYFFEYQQDSLRTRTLNATAPAALQTFSINNALINDYVGNTRVALVTGYISGKNDTLLALHSLANGAGNLTLEAECPLIMKLTRGANRRDFLGISAHPRVSTIINNNQTFETSMVSYDLGMNITGRLSGDLGNLSMKYTIRSAVCSGNQPFVKKAFGMPGNSFFYNSIQLRLKANAHIFSFTLPTMITDFGGTEISGLPVYVGYGLIF